MICARSTSYSKTVYIYIYTVLYILYILYMLFEKPLVSHDVYMHAWNRLFVKQTLTKYSQPTKANCQAEEMSFDVYVCIQWS